jgi:hypothetical protein
MLREVEMAWRGGGELVCVWVPFDNESKKWSISDQ